ncbi:MAG: AraC family transcriptional regulator, partial [Chitinophagaceae bacterium]
SRILRFQMATRLYGVKEKSLTDIAYGCGYYDQSHFIHEFKQFSGYHPRQYFSGSPEGVAWKESN